jgi:hypothetical protein
MLEGQYDFGGFHILADVDHVTVFAARFPEQTPGDRIQQRRFPCAIVS